MSAVTLRRAADKLDALASDAEHHDAKEPGRWMTEHHNSQYHSKPHRAHIAEDRGGIYWTVASEVYIPIAEHVATLDPHAAHLIATWLRATADRVGGKSWTGSRHALAVARAILGESA